MSKHSYGLKLTPKANDDLDEIYSYITGELDAEKAAMRLFEKIETSIMRLRDFPFSCNHVNDEFLKMKGYRKLIVDNYIAFYVVDEEQRQVVVMRVLYGRRKYENIL
ncbi:MAG TPA: type II toxin-antitoxin system RelE/ParE family toxin [Corynebacteriales bacterium]|nr:type II toxin-antitoxin system RelE/ParE family toxin [Mycobacteriales bacterium]